MNSVNTKTGTVVLDGTDIELTDGGGVSVAQSVADLDTQKVAASEIAMERVLEGTSLAVSQQPIGDGTANALMVEFGAAQGSGADPVMIDASGLLTLNEAGLYRVSSFFQFGREGSAGVSLLLFRYLINGSQLGRSVAAKITNANDINYTEITNWFNATSGVTLQVQIMRDPSGNNSGGVFQTAPSDEGVGTWNPSPCAVLRIERLVKAP